MGRERLAWPRARAHLGDEVRQREALERNHLAHDTREILRAVDECLVAVDDIDDRAKLALVRPVIDQADPPDFDVAAEHLLAKKSPRAGGVSERGRWLEARRSRSRTIFSEAHRPHVRACLQRIPAVSRDLIRGGHQKRPSVDGSMSHALPSLRRLPPPPPPIDPPDGGGAREAVSIEPLPND